MRKDNDIAGLKRQARVVVEARDGVAFGEQVVNDHVTVRLVDVGGNLARFRRAEAPGSGEFSVIEECALDLYDLEDFRKGVHKTSTGAKWDLQQIGPDVRANHSLSQTPGQRTRIQNQCSF